MAVAPSLNTLSRNVLKRQLSWYLVVRMLVVCLLLGGSIVYQLQHGSWNDSPATRYLSYLTVLTVLQTLASGYVLDQLKTFQQFIHLQLSWDLLVVALVIFLTGGVESLYPFLYILVIIASSVFLPRSKVLVVASASSILYGSLLDLQYYGYLPTITTRPPLVKLHHYDIFYAVFLHVGAFFLTALLSGALAERFRRSEEARERKEIDYDELERLNQTILTNINSGLMAVNANGRIRSFNGAASRITGYRLEEVYNRPVEAIFPEFDALEKKKDTVERGELKYRKNEEEVLSLGYSVSRIADRGEESSGFIIAFQDLTGYKELEEQLVRADRLAAVGRLASGLAHEIRNPLASISGSVQLMLEDDRVSHEDRHLMNIVVKEAERLNLLLSDFLSFARPSPLQVEIVDVANLLDEFIVLLRASGQFEGVVLEKKYSATINMKIDRQKMHQVLWNLLLNACEAVSKKGTVTVEIDTAAMEIRIEDTGVGIDEKVRSKLFEPFFTTKDEGTGLGLANVYANIEAHKGRIFVEPGKNGGTRFTIDLPEDCWDKQ